MIIRTVEFVSILAIGALCGIIGKQIKEFKNKKNQFQIMNKILTNSFEKRIALILIIFF
ncbi:uncharacterized protein METZ01_LOCUS405680 [marine metagenome]|uniref:Uncharacterized protein n=1 Tax=marine metagenome TaxID=408172 RepID=A0A382W1V3_9ZZZZ